MLKRILTSLVLASIGVPAIIYGGIFFWLLMAVFVVVASWEYINLMRGADFQPSMMISVSGVFIIFLMRTYFPTYESAALIGFVFLSMAYHLVAFERGRDRAAGDFAITIASLVYMGWIGSYLVKLRELPNGLFWFTLVLPIVWFADSGAYLIGKKFGKHKLSPRLSPKKTWEGYWGGVLFGVLGSILFAWPWRHNIEISLLQTILLGLVLSMLTTLGDLGESMIKRQSGIKDSSHILPGHGGIFDRIDTWLWAAPIGYYLVRWFFI